MMLDAWKFWESNVDIEPQISWGVPKISGLDLCKVFKECRPSQNQNQLTKRANQKSQ